MMPASQQPILRFDQCRCAASLRAVLDCLDCAVFLVDESAHVSWQNKRAHRLVRSGDGLIQHDDRLTARWARDNRNLAEALKTPTAATTRITRHSGRPDYVVHAHRLDAEGEDRSGIVALLVTTPDLDVSCASLRQAYGLTPAEARVSLAVVQGDRLADAAQELNVSINTVKSTLQRVFAKTGTRSQLQLARLLTSTVRHAPEPGAARRGAIPHHDRRPRRPPRLATN